MVIPLTCAVMLAVSLTACATPGHRLNNISVGMTKAEVIREMGSPTSTSAQNGIETMRYSLNAGRALFSVDFDDYYVRLVDGRVTAYGKTADLEKGKK
jgi:hypothetical protein